MERLDEEGNLFGVVNVVDALVVLLVLAVVVAGLAVVGVFGVFGETDDGQPATRYATVDLGEQPAHAAAEMEVGDRMVAAGGQNLTVTDVYRSGAAGGTNRDAAHVVVRTRVGGTVQGGGSGADSTLSFTGQPLQNGRQITIDTAEYSREGQVTSVGDAGSTLRTNETSALLEAIVPEHTVDAIETGDEYRVAGDAVATVETVRSYPIEGDRRRVQLGLTLETVRDGGRSTFGTRPVAVGNTLGIYTDAYGLNGTVIRSGSVEPPGQAATTRVELELEKVEPERVRGLGPGTTETERGRTLATIRSVTTEPATVVLESDDGNIYARDHPTKVDVAIEADLATRRTDTGLQFHGEPLRRDRTVTLDFDTVQLRASVTSVDSP